MHVDVKQRERAFITFKAKSNTDAKAPKQLDWNGLCEALHTRLRHGTLLTESLHYDEGVAAVLLRPKGGWMLHATQQAASSNLHSLQCFKSPGVNQRRVPVQ